MATSPRVDADGALLLSKQGLGTSDLEQILAKVDADKVRNLTLDGNCLDTLSPKILSFLQLPLLRALWLDGNKLQELPKEIGRCAFLERLHLADNQLTSLPEEVGELRSLKALNVSRNKLSALPSQLGRCTLLESLWLAGNPLTELPDSFRTLSSLKMLWATDTQLECLPDCTGSWMMLEQLQLMNNPCLKELPSGLGFCSALKKVFLRNTPKLRVPPAEIVSQGVGAIKSFLQQRAEQGLARCWCARWIFAGFERVGKTSLSRALRGLPFNASEQSTDGLGVENLNMDAAQLTKWLPQDGSANDLELPGDEETLQASMWDLAGQSVYYLTHEVFLSSHAVYLLPWRCDRTPPEDAHIGTDDHGKSWRPREGEERKHVDSNQLDHWLSCIRVRSPNAAVLVVGTHAETDERGNKTLNEEERNALQDPKEPIALSLRERYPGLRLHFFLVDSETTYGVDNVRGDLLKMTLQGTAQPLPMVVPKDWFSLQERCAKEALRRVSTEVKELPLLTWNEFQQELASDCPKVRDAVKFWHLLGDILHFGSSEEKDAQLQDWEDFVILRPQWLADVLRCVVTQTGATDDIRNRGGTAKASWLATALKPMGLSEGANLRCALRLFERLELALRWTEGDSGDGDDCYFFPGLLPQGGNRLSSEADMGATNRREVVLEMPGGSRSVGLFPRLLLGALRDGKLVPQKDEAGKPRWRAGEAMLITADGEVLVEILEEEVRAATVLRFAVRSVKLTPVSAGDPKAQLREGRRRDDALRNAIVEALAIITSSFPGLLPASGDDLTQVGAGLLRLICPLCSSRSGLTLTAAEDSFCGLAERPICSACHQGIEDIDGDAGLQRLLGQPVPFSEKSFRPILRGTVISIGLVPQVKAAVKRIEGTAEGTTAAAEDCPAW
eukprot:CAMPEP_0206428256 /NCGR_PEP_ID=MMETSP0324_2-20121206/5541_1 /ASSEMBLY_ACC=CAM_ASM_000836 /TAXON_ID=2866 /ORGANISM="Crypthecodinium cohnii, Strain Seligo" /LENGTH=899 /DNA_ID=CAMNT_0053893719 /DNA_START=39 /DNA_END=2738 /DNA_ORIENTATION=-